MKLLYKPVKEDHPFRLGFKREVVGCFASNLWSDFYEKMIRNNEPLTSTGITSKIFADLCKVGCI